MFGTEDILQKLTELGIEYELHEHEPLLHASDRFEMGLDFGASVCKNLFLTTRTEREFYLMTLPAEKTADLRRTARAIGSSRLCFGSDERLLELLGQRPGMVSLLGAINDRGGRVTALVDASLRGMCVCAHPSDNTKTVVLPMAALERYLKSCGMKILYIDV